MGYVYRIGILGRGCTLLRCFSDLSGSILRMYSSRYMHMFPLHVPPPLLLHYNRRTSFSSNPRLPLPPPRPRDYARLVCISAESAELEHWAIVVVIASWALSPSPSSRVNSFDVIQATSSATRSCRDPGGWLWSISEQRWQCYIALTTSSETTRWSCRHARHCRARAGCEFAGSGVDVGVYPAAWICDNDTNEYDEWQC